jgi:hypothetical protein
MSWALTRISNDKLSCALIFGYNLCDQMDIYWSKVANVVIEENKKYYELGQKNHIDF